MPLDERDLLLKEAEWVWSEMEDFVRQIQRYRLTYVTALFASIGWILGKLVDPMNATLSLADIRSNPAIAAVTLLVPMVNGLFFLLMMEYDLTFVIDSTRRLQYPVGAAGVNDGVQVKRVAVFVD